MAEQKSVMKAYGMGLVGLLFGIVGMHRFYLDFYYTGTLMLVIFVGGIFCFAIGYAHLLAPFLTVLAAGGTDISALPADGLLSQDTKEWFVVGGLLCLASLCWLFLDFIFMSALTKKANELQ